MTKGRLLNSNEGYLRDIHESMVGQKVWVKSYGFYGEVESVEDEEYFNIKDERGGKWRISLFEIRSIA